MDSVAEIKARLPIEQLVGQYCQMTKKGRNFVSLCPFHSDSHPSFLISPDKGIAYCFACNTGGDIFSFYQKIEGVDFPQAVKDLAEKAGVTLEKNFTAGPKKDEKERARECLEAAQKFYQDQLKTSASAQDYLKKRGVPESQISEFGIGVAPDSFTATYEHLLKAGFSRKEIIAAGLGVQKELRDEKIYDRFRNRLMFPIHDGNGRIVGFGGRTLAHDDAKYINSSEGILYHKSDVLYGLHRAKEAMRETGKAIIVEGYFDVLACHRVGFKHVVAASGTAFTEQHGKIIKRTCESAILCLDQDRAGREAAERAFHLLAQSGLHVQAVVLPAKDPADTVQEDPDLLRTLLGEGGQSYVDVVLAELHALDLTNALVKKQALARFLTLLTSLDSAVLQEEFLRKASRVFQASETSLQQDLRTIQLASLTAPGHRLPGAGQAEAEGPHGFSATEIVLGLLLLHPQHVSLLPELIPPQDDAFCAAVHRAIVTAPQGARPLPDRLEMEPLERERLGVILLFCEEHGMGEWNESHAEREIRKNILMANREMLKMKQQALTKELVLAKSQGRMDDEEQLARQYQGLLELLKKSR